MMIPKNQNPLFYATGDKDEVKFAAQCAIDFLQEVMVADDEDVDSANEYLKRFKPLWMDLTDFIHAFNLKPMKKESLGPEEVTPDEPRDQG